MMDNKDISNQKKKQQSTAKSQAQKSSQPSGKTNVKNTSAKQQKPAIAQIATFSLAAVACVLAGIALLQIDSLQSNKLAKFDQVNQQIEAVSKQQQVLSSEMDKALATVEKSQVSYGDSIKALQQSLAKALKQQNYNTNDWLLHKAAYYLQLAQVTLYWTNDTSSTITLLQTADNLLAKINNTKLFTIRQRIAHEVAALKVVPTVDKTGLLSQLSALGGQFINLPLNKHKFEVQAPKAKSPQQQTTNHWQQTWHNSVATLKQLVIIRYHKRDIKPILSPSQQQIVIQRMKLSISQMQWAVIHNDQSAFDFSIKQIINTIDSYFDSKAALSQKVVKELQQLQSIKLTPTKPNISSSTQLLNQFIEQGVSQQGDAS